MVPKFSLRMVAWRIFMSYLLLPDPEEAKGTTAFIVESVSRIFRREKRKQNGHSFVSDDRSYF